jgi:hypothetical protein
MNNAIIQTTGGLEARIPHPPLDQGKNLRRRSGKFVETSKDLLQDALDQGADAFKQAKKAAA